MLIFSSQTSPRLTYIFDFIFKETLGVDYEMTSNEDFFINSDDYVKWTYGHKIDLFPSVSSSPLLFEKTIEAQPLEKKEIDDIICLFKDDHHNEENEEDILHYDIFASAFYLISRYEEYLPSVIDSHERYAAYQSVAAEFGFLHTAMVNRYILWFMDWLKNFYPDLDVQIQKPKSLISIDIDHPFYSKDISMGKWIQRTIKNLGNSTQFDKYDTYEFIYNTIGELPSISFFLCPKNPIELDHFNKREAANFKQLIQSVRQRSQIGIHPSYLAEKNQLIEEEISWLSGEHNKKIKSSRFHYLRFNIETSFQLLIKNEIQNDFSMAYGDSSGFRSSTSLPFYFFDLKKNKRTNLRIFTPCIMDSTYKYNYQSGYKDSIHQLILEIKTYGGYFIPIIHNDIIAEEEWKDNFKALVREIELFL